MKKLVYLSFIAFFIVCSCGSDSSQKLNFDVSHINIPYFKIKRYEQDLFKIDTLFFLQELNAIQNQYSVFLGNEKIEEEYAQPLYKYITDPKLRQLNIEVQKKYSDISFLEKELKNAFQYYLYYFPDAQLPDVYTYISGLYYEYPIQISDQAMIIGLDLYLGANFQTYKDHGIPVYKSKRMTNEHITIDCMKELAQVFIDNNIVHKNFLEEIIHNAKTLYFVDALLPTKADHFKIGFNEEQLNWCKSNEQNIWAFFIDQQILYSADYELTRKFTQDGPFTLAFSRNAPAKIGDWIGWQILRAYMNNNPEVMLNQLLQETNAQKILKESKYKPRK